MDIKYFSPSLVALIRAAGTAIWNNDIDILDQSISGLKVEIDSMPDNIGANAPTNLSGLTTGMNLPPGATTGGLQLGPTGAINSGPALFASTNTATVSTLPRQNLAKILLQSTAQLANVYYRYLIDNTFNTNPNAVRFSRAFGDWLEEYNTFLGDEPIAIVNAFSNLGAFVSRGVDPTSWEYKAIEELRRIFLTDKVQGKSPRQNDLLFDGPRSPGGGTQVDTGNGASPGGGISVTPPDPSTLAIPVDNANLCAFYLETRQVQNPGTRIVTHTGRTFTINNPCDIEIKLHRHCSITVPRRIDACGNDISAGTDVFDPETSYVVVDWTRIASSKLSFTVKDCGNGKSKKLEYQYYFDLPEIVTNYNTLLKRYDIIVPDGQNAKGGCQISQKIPFDSSFRQYSSINLLDHIVSRTIDPTVYYSTGPNSTNRNKKLKGAYSPDYPYLGVYARNPQFIQPGGDVGDILSSIANKRFVDNFNRTFTYAAPLWLKSINDNLSIMSSVEAIIRGNSDQNINGSIKNWYKQNFGYTDGWKIITDISEYDNLSVEQMSYPYRDTLSPTPNDPLQYFVASVLSACGSVSECDTPIQPITTDCNKPVDEITKRVHWKLKESPTTVYRDIDDGKNEYDSNSELYKALTINNPFDGSVKVSTDKSFNVFYGNNSVLKTIQTGVDIPNIPIPGRRCYTGTSRQYVIDIKRQQKVYMDIMCTTNGITVDYVSKTNDIAKSENDSLISKEDFTLPAVKGPYVQKLVLGDGRAGSSNNGSYPNAILDTTNGKWYVWKDVHVPFYDETGERFFTTIVADDSIQLNRANDECSPTTKQCNQTEPIPDPTNPCGCTDFIIERCDEIYEGFTYIDGFGTTKIIETQTVPEQFSPNADYSFLSITERIIGVVPSTRAECNPSSIRSFHPLIFGYDLLTGVKKDMIYGLFSGSQSPTCYLTSSTQTNTSKAYYYDIVDCPTSCSNSPYFAIAYGHHNGSGSISSGYDASDSPSKAMYSQYRLKALEMPTTKFTFTDIAQTDMLSLNAAFTDPKDIYVMNFYRENLSYRLDVGNFEISLVELSGSYYANNVHTGSNVKVNSSNKILTLIDNSGDADESLLCGNDPFSSFDVVSGSITNGIYTEDSSTQIPVYGRVYPNLGIIVLNGGRLNDYLSFNSVTGSNIAGDNAFKLYTSISGAAALGHPLKARSVKTKTTNHYFVRVPTSDANYTTNPTYVLHDSNEKGKLKYDCFVANPVTYITSIGLYNDKKDLLAIAKLNKPIKKTPENDILVKIRLNW